MRSAKACAWGAIAALLLFTAAAVNAQVEIVPQSPANPPAPAAQPAEVGSSRRRARG